MVAQYCSRMIAGAPYLQVGSGLSNLTGPSLFFLASGYQPMFYVDKLLLSENHVFFTLMILAGLPFCWKHPGFRYVVVLLATCLFYIPTFWPRFSEILLLLSTARDYGRRRSDGDALRPHPGARSTCGRFDRGAGRRARHRLGLLLLLFVQSNESVLKEYQLSSTGDTPQMMTRLGTYRYDYRGVADFVKTHARPGDVILPGIPHVFNYYAGIPGDYFLDTLFSSKVPYNQLLERTEIC